MRLGSSLKMVILGLAGLTLLSAMAVAQQTESVADAARKAREQKKAAAKSKKVITDDDLPTAKAGEGGVTVVGQGRAEGQAPVSDTQTTTNVADSAKSAAEEDAEAARLKARVAQAEKELDLLQRELALDQDAYYSKTNYANDTAGKAKLDAEKQQVSDKQQDLERLKTRLAAVQELQSRRKPAQAGTTNPPASSGDKPAAPPPSNPLQR